LDAEDADTNSLLTTDLPSFSGLVAFVAAEHPAKPVATFLQEAEHAGYDRVIYGLPGRRPHSIVDVLNEASHASSVSIDTNWANMLASGEGGQGGGYDAPRARGMVIIVLSPKGGTGKTTITLNLADALAAGRSTVVWDCNWGNPGCAMHFGLEVETGIEGLADLPRITQDTVRPYLVQTRNSLSILPGPSTKYIGKGRVEIRSATFWVDVLESLREMFDVVVIDTPQDWDDASVANLARLADRVYVVEDQTKYTEVETMRQAPKLGAVGVMPERIRLVINRYLPGGHKEREILSAFNKSFRSGTPANLLPRVAAVLGENWETYVRAQWQGKAVSTADANIARQWQALVQDAVPEAILAVPARRGWFGRRR
jgi:MinD-like ATPase involved in chromosome partitioning or flagellar assembly